MAELIKYNPPPESRWVVKPRPKNPAKPEWTLDELALLANDGIPGLTPYVSSYYPTVTIDQIQRALQPDIFMPNNKLGFEDRAITALLGRLAPMLAHFVQKKFRDQKIGGGLLYVNEIVAETQLRLMEHLPEWRAYVNPVGAHLNGELQLPLPLARPILNVVEVKEKRGEFEEGLYYHPKEKRKNDQIVSFAWKIAQNYIYDLQRSDERYLEAISRLTNVCTVSKEREVERYANDLAADVKAKFGISLDEITFNEKLRQPGYQDTPWYGPLRSSCDLLDRLIAEALEDEDGDPRLPFLFRLQYDPTFREESAPAYAAVYNNPERDFSDLTWFELARALDLPDNEKGYAKAKRLNRNLENRLQKAIIKYRDMLASEVRVLSKPIRAQRWDANLTEEERAHLHLLQTQGIQPPPHIENALIAKGIEFKMQKRRPKLTKDEKRELAAWDEGFPIDNGIFVDLIDKGYIPAGSNNPIPRGGLSGFGWY